MVSRAASLTVDSVAASNVRLLRRQRGWTQREFAKLLGRRDTKRWTLSMVSDLERSSTARTDGRPNRQISAQELAVFSRTFQVSLLALLLPASDALVRIGDAHYSRADFVDLVLQFPADAMPTDFHDALRRQYEVRNQNDDRLRWLSRPSRRRHRHPMRKEIR